MPDRADAECRVLFVATNGGGMGHLTRVLAVARRLPPKIQPILLTWSKAIRLVRQLGYFAEFMPSMHTMRCSAEVWNEAFLIRLQEMLELFDPRVIVYDGIFPHTAFAQIKQNRSGPELVWCRRGLWQPGKAQENVGCSDYFHHVLEPGDVAEEVDVGATRAQRAQVVRVPPIMFPDWDDLLAPELARQALGLDEGRVNVLVQLGSGTPDPPTEAVLQALIRIRDIQIVLAQSPIAPLALAPPLGVRAVTLYPISQYYRAFDFAIAASGYNALHELLAFAVPTAFIPNLDSQVDDQVARARYVADQGLALSVEQPTNEALRQAIGRLADPTEAATLRARNKAWNHRNGAADAARWIHGRAIPEDAGAGPC